MIEIHVFFLEPIFRGAFAVSRLVAGKDGEMAPLPLVLVYNNPVWGWLAKYFPDGIVVD